MNNLYKKLNRESEHIRLTADEKRAIKARVFGAPSPVRVARSPYVFVATHRWITALAAVVLVVFAGASTAFAAQGALPGQPLYALKTQVIEKVQVALAPTPAAKAAVHVALAQQRVEEAETLAQQGALTASTSAELAANFESNAQSAETIAAQIATSDPATAVQIQTQLSASSAVGGAVLAALGNGSGSRDKGDADALAVRVAARGRHQDSGSASDVSASSTVTVAIATATASPKSASIRTFAAATSAQATSSGASSTQAPQAETASLNLRTESTAAQLEQKAQDALEAARASFVSASSTLDASTTVAVQASLDGIDALMSGGSSALGDSLYDTAVKDFTDALGRSLRLEALLKAQQTFDNNSIVPLFNGH